MIIDKLENAHLYAGLGERINKAFEYLKITDFSKVEAGKHPIDGENIFAAVSEYQTKELSDAKLEAHLNYLDVQYVVSGVEQMGYVALEGQTPTVAYNPEKDVVFYKEEVSFTKVPAGSFAIFFPTDVHMPSVAVGAPSTVKKVVVKVKIK